MTLDWTHLALVVASIAAGCGASYFLLLGKLRRILTENQREMEHRLAALTEAIRAGTAVSPEFGTDALSSAEMEPEAAAVRVAGAPKNDQHVAEHTQKTAQVDEITPEIRAAIAAAAIAALGNHARVRSARKIPSSNMVSPWTQQGRVIVQSSHNLRTQGSR